ncbi:MAG: DUF2207 domain-containing protein, partial [Anaerolineae bacterium]|nr:DUF2207 domain-containing protein [Anaerolineae bacterium]
MSRKLSIALIFVVFLGLVGGVRAQDQDLYWDRLDADITVQKNSDILITETWEVTFTEGSVHSLYRNVPTDRLEDISLVEVLADGQKTVPGRETPYTYETYYEDDDYVIKVYFPYTQDSTHTYVISYLVEGGLRIYEGGDQIWWKAIFSDRDFPIRSSTVTVHLPEGVSEVQNVAAYGWDASFDVRDSRTVIFMAQDISPGQEMEVRVQFPHGIVEASPPSWQAAEDFRASVRPWANLGSLCLGLFIPLAAFLGLYILWYTRGRDRPIRMPADNLAEPPSDLPAGVVGTLLDERADMKDIVATIVDLARRGVIQMKEVEEPGFLGIGSHRDVTFLRGETEGKEEGLRQYERTLLKRLFGRRPAVNLSDLKNKFYTAIPILQKELYEEAVKLGFFTQSPERTRNIYYGLGCAGIVLSGILGFCGMAVLSEITGLAIFPFIGLGLAFIGVVIFGRYMPRKSGEGSMEAAKWRAFKRYLENIERYTDLQEAKDIFDKGCDDFIQKPFSINQIS